MKYFLWAAFLIATQLPALAQSKLGTIEGSVVRSDTSEPISNTLVRANSISKGTSTQLQAFTDESGRFVIGDVPPGTYDVQAYSAGFNIPAQVVVQKGDPVHSITLTSIPKSIIHGRVLQPDGQPAAGVSVELATQRYGNAKLSVIRAEQPIQTNPRGEYRFEVRAGEYFVRTSGSEQNWHTYFPATIDPAKAEELHAKVGGDLSADIRLSDVPAFKISVRIVDLVPDRGARHVSRFYLTERNATVQEMEFVPVGGGCTCPPSGPSVPSTPFVAQSSDRFEIRGIHPGSYELRAVMWVGDIDPYVFRLYKPGEPIPISPIFSGRSTIEVRDSDVEATVEIRPGVPLRRAEVKGRVTSNGKSVAKDTAELSLYDATGSVTEYLSALVDRSGRFTISGVPEGNYRISSSLRSPDAFVEDVRQGGVSILDSGLIVNDASVEPLEVIVNPVGGVIDGQIESGKPALIALISASGSNKGTTMKVVHANASGVFKLQGIPPGEYRILAFDDIGLNGRNGGAIFSPFFTDKYLSQSVPVTIRSGVPVMLRLASINP